MSYTISIWIETTLSDDEYVCMWLCVRDMVAQLCVQPFINIHAKIAHCSLHHMWMFVSCVCVCLCVCTMYVAIIKIRVVQKLVGNAEQSCCIAYKIIITTTILQFVSFHKIPNSVHSTLEHTRRTQIHKCTWLPSEFMATTHTHSQSTFLIPLAFTRHDSTHIHTRHQHPPPPFNHSHWMWTTNSSETKPISIHCLHFILFISFHSPFSFRWSERIQPICQCVN